MILYPDPDLDGGGSAQSTLRSSLRRPPAPARCSRHERPLDTLDSCAASSRVESPTSLPPPPWLFPWPCRGSDVNILAAFVDRSALLPAPLPPAGRVANPFVFFSVDECSPLDNTTAIRQDRVTGLAFQVARPFRVLGGSGFSVLCVPWPDKLIRIYGRSLLHFITFSCCRRAVWSAKIAHPRKPRG
jgi:hypothetical protein